MSTPIRTWTDAYAAIRDAVEARRGFIELSPNTPQATRWPRATGAHVVAIAAVLDPPLRASPPAFGRAALLQQWRDVLVDAEAIALLEPARTYPMARAFWSAVRAVCVHLDHVGVRVPDRAHWAALLDVLDQDDAAARRNANALPSDLLRDERLACLKLRGTDSTADVPPAHYPIVALTELFYPKATVGDVVTLAIRWNERLASAMRAKPGALVAAATAWHRIVDDVTATTRGVAPDQVYAHGHAFWDGLSVLAMAMDEVLAPEAFALRIAAGRVRSRVEDIPGTLTRGAESAGDAVVSVVDGVGGLLGDLASGAGKVVGGAAKGFLDPFVMPLAIGGGVLAVYLLTRDGGAPAEKGAA